MSYLVQILLPLADNNGAPFAPDIMAELQTELTHRFGGVTAYSRAPAKGIWARRHDHQTDDIVMVEVMTDDFDEAWWQQLRQRLESDLRQDAIVIRAQMIRIV